MSVTTAVMIFHPATDAAGFETWAKQLQAAAAAGDGWVSGAVSVHDDALLDWACALSFGTEDLLHRWLDSDACVAVLRDGESHGCWRKSSELILGGQHDAPVGVSAFRHSVAAGSEDEFRSAQIALAAAAATFPGYLGTVVVLPGGAGPEWLSLVRFRSAAHLSAWTRSAERDAVLTGLRSSLTADFTVDTQTTPFATVVRSENGRTLMTPNWKAAMVVLLVLYPTVMLLSRFLGPTLNALGAQPWLALWVSQIVSVCLMQWWLMPAATRPFTRWLDPVDGAGVRITLLGAAVVLVLYAVTSYGVRHRALAAILGLRWVMTLSTTGSR